MSRAITLDEALSWRSVARAMRDEIRQMILDLDAIPPDQRTPAMEGLLQNLQTAIEQYDKEDEQ